MQTRTLVATVLLASLLVAGVARASGASTPVLYVRIEGTAGNVEISPTPTLLRDCTTYCAYRLPPGATQSIRVTARSYGGRFVTWGTYDPRFPSPCTGTNPVCVASLTQSASLRAYFSPITVVVHAATGGSATVDGRSCGGGCGIFDYGSVVHLSATANGGYSFSGWSGACGRSNSSTCVGTVHVNIETTALFRCTDPTACSNEGPITTPVPVHVKVVGPGHVLGPAGLSCDFRRTCTVSRDLGTQVTLRAVADGGAFRYWSSNTVACRSLICQFPAVKSVRGFDPVVIATFS
jgi:hypothetical protein